MTLRKLWSFAWIGAALAAPVQAATFREAEVVEAANGQLILARSAGREEVVALEPGATLLGLDTLLELYPGYLIRYVPSRREAHVTYATELELLPAVATVGARIDVGVLEAELYPSRGPPGEGRVVPVDVRSAEAFARGHLPGAISAPWPGARLATVLPRDKAARLVLYGASRQDPAAVTALREALRLGYGKAAVYLEGMRQWEKGRRPTEVLARDVLGGIERDRLLVLDVRPKEEQAQGTLPGAVTLAPDQFRVQEWIGRPGMPLLLLVGRGEDDPVPWEVAARIRAIQPSGESLPLGGLKVLRGGFPAWKAARGAVAKAAQALASLPCRPDRKEVCPDEFTALWRSGDARGAPLLLDVRPGAGGFRPAWAKHIPLEELPTRLAELTRDREILVFCTRGIASRVAVGLLESVGYRARHLADPPPTGP